MIKIVPDMLLEGYAGKLKPAQIAMVKSIYESNERQITIVNDLLKVAHVDAGQVNIQKQRINLCQLIGDIIKEQEHKFKTRHQKVVFSQRRDTIEAVVDPKNLRMVIENIVDNASKYTPDNKSIELKLAAKKKNIDIIIKDQGVGIEPRDIPKIFKKFSRLSNPLSVLVGGTGLGLYWAKKIVQLHGGTIRVASVVDQGTTFTITIPVRKRISGRTKPAALTSTSVSRVDAIPA